MSRLQAHVCVLQTSMTVSAHHLHLQCVTICCLWSDSWENSTFEMWLGSVRIPFKEFLANVLWSHYYRHKTHRNSHTLLGWLLDGNRKGQSLSLSWRNMASERRVKSNLWMGLQPVVLRRSFHPFPQHGGTSIHKVDVVGAQHGCSTSHRSHDQDTRCEEVCAVTL